MSRALPARVTACFVAALATFGSRPQASVAQVVGGVDLTFASDYLWRGLTRANDWVFQAAAYVGLELWSGYLTGEWWNSSELFGAGLEDLTGAGASRGGWTERNWSVQYVFAAGDWIVGLGWVEYRFLGDEEAGGRGAANNTRELFSSIEWRRIVAFAPKIAVWYDYEAVGGTYVELSGSFRVPMTSLGVESTFYVDVIAGASLGQEKSTRETYYFERRGFTHVVVAPTFVVSLQPVLRRWLNTARVPSLSLLVEPIRFQRNIDPATRRTSGLEIDENKETKWRFLRVTVSVGLP